MSLEIVVYCNEVSAGLIPQIMKRLNDYDMIAEIHPKFEFDKNIDTGFLPFKFRFTNPSRVVLKDKEFLSGFELFIENFDLKSIKDKLQPKLSLFEKLFGKKQPEIDFANPEIDNKLLDCKKAISFVWHSGDTFQLRFVLLFSAILTEITNGVCNYPADDVWYDNHDIVNKAFMDVISYENSLKASEIKFFEFQSW